jgi:hypothetical protein
MASNRKTVRKALAALITSGVTGLQKVYDYRVGDFGGQSPVATVSSSGSQRERLTFAGSKATMAFQVDVFALYSDGGSWGEDDAEDAIDDIEAAIADVVDANQVTANWRALSLEGRSQRIDVEIGGVEYVRESMIIVAGVY